MTANRHQILEALPTFGPLAIALPSDFAGVSQGYVVKFSPASQESWIGNFRCGETSYSAVHDFPDESRIVVIAGGADYLVNPKTRTVEGHSAENISFSKSLADLEIIVFGNNTRFWAEGQQGRVWSTDRLSWDGIRVVAISENVLRGECYSALDEAWHSFTLDLASGEVSGNVFETDSKQIQQVVPDRS